ncbi:hypothetical protein C8R47DRAFT_1082013 [Mycena vitilis]|nr:hypothetical protein C8R47DRAFT_1082013 [Mycena vitilis]
MNAASEGMRSGERNDCGILRFRSEGTMNIGKKTHAGRNYRFHEFTIHPTFICPEFEGKRTRTGTLEPEFEYRKFSSLLVIIERRYGTPQLGAQSDVAPLPADSGKKSGGKRAGIKSLLYLRFLEPQLGEGAFGWRYLGLKCCDTRAVRCKLGKHVGVGSYDGERLQNARLLMKRPSAVSLGRRAKGSSQALRLSLLSLG